MRLRAIATDIDHTLTDERHLLDLDAVRVIRLLEAAGLPVILASGRDLTSLGTLGVYVGTCGLVVAEDGGIVGNLRPESFGVRPLADPSRVHEALAALKGAFGGRVQVVPIPARVVSLVLLRTIDRDEANAFLEAEGLRARVLDSGLAYELADADVDKGRGLAEAVSTLGLAPAEVAAIGDNHNDVEMFRTAGWSAAVANAPDEVKDEAGYVCAASHGQGFIEAVRRALELYRPDLARLPWPVAPPADAEAAGG